MTITLSDRNLSLDVIRGFAVALMIVVNIPGDYKNVYTALAHSHWHGFTLADFVFPTFLFVVGNSIAFSFYKHREIDNWRVFGKVVRRTLVLFALGLLLNYFPFFRFENATWVAINPIDVRFWGVLQRIAVCYGLASVLVRFMQEKHLIVFCVAALWAYGLTLKFGSTTADPYALETLKFNAVSRLDSVILPSRNIAQAYGAALDPEGLLSTLPALVNVIAGYLAARWMQSMPTWRSVGLFVIGGVGLLGSALLIEPLVPINKPLWTSTYVLFSTGWDLLFLAALMLVIEGLGLRRWAYFFDVLGRNPIFLYVLSIIGFYGLAMFTGMKLEFSRFFFGDTLVAAVGVKNASLIFSLLYLLVLWGLACVLERNRIHIKI